jgi:hypothetical protein
MIRSLRTIACLVAIAALAACGQEVAFETLETARKQARENAEYNARKWRADTKVHAEANIVSRGDSTQAPACPQGDGWASMDMTNQNGQVLAKLKCSTVSDSVGCREEKDFKSSPYANEDGSCQAVSKVPHPLPKIAK